MKTTTIVFRGLMVLHKQANTMEIGFVNALYNPEAEHDHSTEPASHADHSNHEVVHIPRILTTKNGVLSSILDLRNRPELGTVRNWELVVTNPVDAEVTLFPQVVPPGSALAPFDRAREGSGDTFEKDFRWITDLEADDLHGRDLSLEINTRQFLFVLYVRNGLFYTKLRSPSLRRRRLSQSYREPYGRTAAVVGCEITVADDGGVRLMAGGTDGSIVFDFDQGEGTVYEISNGPPDVPVEGPASLDDSGHFHMYYDKLFNQPHRDQFDLMTDDQAPAPDPTLCGVTFLGKRQDPL
jgi:hypothetical protein